MTPTPTSSAAPVIEAHDLWFGYDGAPVLRSVTLAVQPQDYVCIVGPNGGGKTTLLKLVLGLLTPQRGELRVFGVSPRQARPRVGYMPQHAHLDALFPATVMDVVLTGRLGVTRALGPYRRRDREIAARVLNEVKLFELRERTLSALSGGQRQRTLIARALAGEPELLLLDEPTSNLDIGVQDDFHELLRRLNERMTLMVVSHDVGFVQHNVKSVLCINREARVHPTSALTGELISDLYGRNVRIVRHDHEHA